MSFNSFNEINMLNVFFLFCTVREIYLIAFGYNIANQKNLKPIFLIETI